MDSANVGYSYNLPSGGWNHKIRNTLSQFSDLFSEFNKYIAPAYHHDRCERSVQMRVYSMHKGEFVMVYVAFFSCFILAVFIGLAGPTPTLTTSIPGSKTLNNSTNIYGGPFHIHAPPVDTTFQQMWIYAEVLTNNNDEEIFDKSFHVSISIDAVLDTNKILNLIPESEDTNRTRHLHCQQQDCERLMIIHLPSLEYAQYVVNVRLYGLHEFHKRYYIRDVIFYIKTYNPAFTQLETWFRFIFLVTTFVVTCWFAHSLRNFSVHDWALEQKWLSILLPLLLLYNNPIFPLQLISSGWIAPFLDFTFQNTFVATMLLSWLSLYHGLRQNERSYVSFYLFKVIAVGALWTPSMVITVWQKYSGYCDPTFDYTHSPDYPVVKWVFLGSLAFYFLFLAVLIVKAYSDLRSMPFFDVRLRCVSWSAGAVATGLSLVWLSGWGPGSARDHAIAGGEGRPHATAAPFLATCGLLNFNVYMLAYLFSPGGSSVHETAITKDNPAFSMINDSDEEVIYGSDEDSRRLLNTHRRVTDQI